MTFSETTTHEDIITAFLNQYKSSITPQELSLILSYGMFVYQLEKKQQTKPRTIPHSTSFKEKTTPYTFPDNTNYLTANCKNSEDDTECHF
jgi:hypothetical protein